MQHIASRESLQALTAHVLSVADPLDDAGLSALGSDLDGVADLLLNQVQLRRTLSESTLEPDTRAGIAGRLFTGKVGEAAADVLGFAVRQSWSSARDLQEAVRRASRTAMFLRAERAGELDDVEDQLFRFTRIVEAAPDLSVILDDPTSDPAARAELVHRLLSGRVHPLVGELTDALARDTGGRSFSHGVRELVDQAAERRDKVVAIVKSAVALDARQTSRLVSVLSRIYGRDVSVHVEVDPAVVGGVQVRVGDEVIDGSAAAKLEALRRRLAG